MKTQDVSDAINLDYRPTTYFRPQKLEAYLLSKIKGAVVRKELKALFAQGQHAQVLELLTNQALSASDRKILEAIHPLFMGGNYLPDTEDGEVEIARISIQSTTGDVTCIFAKPDNGVIRYRVVDEYGGDTLQEPTEATTSEPMTLGALTDFFFQAWPLIDVAESNFEDDVDGALGFFTADSEFYPYFDQLCRQRMREHFPEIEPESAAGDHCPVCDYFNSPPADDTCRHICATVWDGQVEAVHDAKLLETALRDLSELIKLEQEEAVLQPVLEVESKRSLIRSQLIDMAMEEFNLDGALTTLLQAEAGSGWSTEGMLGGSGYNIYCVNPEQLSLLATECHAIVQACLKTKATG